MAAIRRLRDHPAIARIERAAVMKRSLASDMANYTSEEALSEISREVFGVSYDDIGVDDDADYEQWSVFYSRYHLADAPDWDQVRGFAALGWDVTDEYGRPLLVLRRFSYQLLAAILGEFGATLPGDAPTSTKSFAEAMEREKEAFLKAKRAGGRSA